METHKHCVRCGDLKPVSEFWADRYAADGRRNSCKPCSKAKPTRAWQHRMTSVDEASMTGVCASCGPVRVVLKRNKAGGRLRYSCGPAEWRWNGQRRHRGISGLDIEALIQMQGGVCAICADPVDLAVRNGACVDHCHTTGAVRGVLCLHCNAAIGYLRDSPERAIGAARYLEKHRNGAPRP